MAQTPAQRRAQRDAYARSLTDPRTGQPFKNYNALDTYQRNEKAKQRGFTSRAAERGAPALSLRGIDYTQPSQPFPLEWVTGKVKDFGEWDVFEDEVYA